MSTQSIKNPLALLKPHNLFKFAVGVVAVAAGKSSARPLDSFAPGEALALAPAGAPKASLAPAKAPKALPVVENRVTGRGPPVFNGLPEALALAGAPIPQTAGRARLRIDSARLETSQEVTNSTFYEDDCALAENSLGNDLVPLQGNLTEGVWRKLLRFDVSIVNDGDGDFHMGHPSEHPEAYEWGQCHEHWHAKNFTSYLLLDNKKNHVVAGHKQAFCLEDYEQYNPDAGEGKFSCGNQGISPGWSDVYSAGLDGQWLDITGVPAGNYTLRVEIDPTNRYAEAHDAPVVATVPVTIVDAIKEDTEDGYKR